MNADALAELERLGDLRAKGVLTDAEFTTLKTRVLQPSAAASAPAFRADPDDALLRRLATYQQVSGVVWLIIAALQILGGVTVRSDLWLVIAGVWNIFAGVSRFGAAKQIRARDPGVPEAFEGVVQLAIIALINLFVGGVIGLIWVGFDVFVRWQVLKNRALFIAPKAAATVVAASATPTAVPVSP